MSKLTQRYARFPVPPTCTAKWTTEDWKEWVDENGEQGVLSICARRWSDSYGNTYHSRRVTLNGKAVEVANCNFCYGYGSQYEDETKAALLAHDVLDIPEDCPEHGLPLWQICEYNGLKLESEYADVTRRKDLHGGGR